MKKLNKDQRKISKIGLIPYMEAFIKSAELVHNKLLRDSIEINELPLKYQKYIQFLFPNQNESILPDFFAPVEERREN